MAQHEVSIQGGMWFNLNWKKNCLRIRYHSRDDLAGVADDAIFGSVHVQGDHAGNVLDESDLLEALDTGGTHGAVMASGRDNDLGLDDIGVHARLGVMVQGDQSPVGDHTSDTTVLDNQVFSSQGVEQLDIGAHEQLAEDGRGEQGGVLNHDVVLVAVVKWDTDFGQEVLAGLADNHGREELAAQPGTTTGRDALLNDSDLDVGVLGKLPGAAETLRKGMVKSGRERK